MATRTRAFLAIQADRLDQAKVYPRPSLGDQAKACPAPRGRQTPITVCLEAGTQTRGCRVFPVPRTRACLVVATQADRVKGCRAGGRFTR